MAPPTLPALALCLLPLPQSEGIETAPSPTVVAASERPPAPYGLVVEPVSPCDLRLRWSTVAEGAAFRIARQQGCGGFVVLTDVPPGTFEFFDRDVPHEATLTYRVFTLLDGARSRPAVASRTTGRGPLELVLDDPPAPGKLPEVWPENELHLPFTVTGPKGANVTLTLLHAPPGLTFVPRVDQPLPLAVGLRWWVDSRPGIETLRFRARAEGCTQHFEIPIQVRGGRYGGTEVADFTGDGRLDLLAASRGREGRGAFLLFDPASQAPDRPRARLHVPELPPVTSSSSRLGLNFRGYVAHDVTGDGIADLVVGATLEQLATSEANVVAYVWAGGCELEGDCPPTARLTSPWPCSGSSFYLADVSGDGLVDLITTESGPYELLAGIGRHTVRFGGPGLLEDPDPDAILATPTLGSYVSPIEVGDFTGDGWLDIVGLSPHADVHATDDGAVVLWAGAEGWSGTRMPTAVLAPDEGEHHSRLGSSFGPRGLFLEDVTGDGRLDVVTVSSYRLEGRGAIHVWRGGPSTKAARLPDATLLASDPQPGDHLGDTTRFGDVTGDGIQDIVSVSERADHVFLDTGCAYVWAGGPNLREVLPPSATLSSASPSTGDELGVSGCELHDLTGDGLRDVVLATFRADENFVTNGGALYVFAGGPTLRGEVQPRASLVRGPGAAIGDQIGFWGLDRPGVFEDLDGDGIRDVLMLSIHSDVNGVEDAGAVLFWKGGPTMQGTYHATAALQDEQAGGLGNARATTLVIGDVTGDGRRDLVCGAPSADVEGVSRAGRLYVWSGTDLSGTPAPWARLESDVPAHSDQVGNSYEGPATVLVDVDGDGVLDVVSRVEEARVPGVPNAEEAGAVRLWRGGSSLQGTPDQMAELELPNPGYEDRLSGSRFQNYGLRLVDLNADGVLDLLATSSPRSLAVIRQGAIYQWRGRAAWPTLPAPDLEFHDDQAESYSRLGE